MTKVKPKKYPARLKKIKSHYPEFQKASRTIADIIINHQEKPQCMRCRKSLKKLQDGCANRAIKGFQVGKKEKGVDANTFSSLPFGFMSGTFVDTPYSLLCHECVSFVKRSCGKIPEIWDSKYFPQVSAPFPTLENGKIDFDNFGKKKTKWTIRFMGQSVPHTKALKERMMNLGVTKYKRDFPECPHSKAMLKKLVNSHKLYDRMYGRW